MILTMVIAGLMFTFLLVYAALRTHNYKTNDYEHVEPAKEADKINLYLVCLGL